jgi:hypothetical protein
LSLAGNNKFHVLVTMSCLDNEGEGVAEAVVSSDIKPSEDSLSKNGGAPIATLASSPSSPSRPPLDIICVLDTSGSMSSDNKLKNLIFAGDFSPPPPFDLLLIGKLCSELHSWGAL